MIPNTDKSKDISIVIIVIKPTSLNWASKPEINKFILANFFYISGNLYKHLIYFKSVKQSSFTNYFYIKTEPEVS